MSVYTGMPGITGGGWPAQELTGLGYGMTVHQLWLGEKNLVITKHDCSVTSLSSRAGDGTWPCRRAEAGRAVPL